MKPEDANSAISSKIDFYFGVFSFFGSIAAYQLFGAGAAVKVFGISFMCVGCVWIWGGVIPFGIENRPPMGEIGGVSARVMGVIFFLVGLLMLIYSMQIACAMGWAELGNCERAK